MSGPVQRARAVQPQWAATSARERLALLCRLRGAITGRMDEIVAVVCGEIGKPAMDALTGDVMVTLETLRYLEKHTVREMRVRRVSKPFLLFSGANFTERRDPYGVALVIAPWNYPLQLAMVPAVTALATGNAVILKCSERAPATAQLIASLFRDAGFSDDLVQVLSASPEQTEALIDARPDIAFFTGSSRNGVLVAKRAAALLIPTVLELGGKDACLVFASSNIARAIEGVCYGAFSNAGQVCLGIKRLYVERSVFSEFLQGFVQRSQELRMGDGVDADMGTIRFEFLRTLIAEQVEDAIALGAVLHTPWDRSDIAAPIILSGVPDGARLMTEESFGPVVCVTPFDTEDQGIQFANASRFALGASVFTADLVQGRRVAAALRSGGCSINDSVRSAGNPYAAFGGNDGSGNGRYHGAAGIRAFTRITTVMEVSGRKRREVHWFPFTQSTYRALRGFLLLRHSFRSPLATLRRTFETSK